MLLKILILLLLNKNVYALDLNKYKYCTHNECTIKEYKSQYYLRLQEQRRQQQRFINQYKRLLRDNKQNIKKIK